VPACAAISKAGAPYEDAGVSMQQLADEFGARAALGVAPIPAASFFSEQEVLQDFPAAMRAKTMRSLFSRISMVKLGMVSRPRLVGNSVCGSSSTLA
jgi:hypothetical protein